MTLRDKLEYILQAEIFTILMYACVCTHSWGSVGVLVLVFMMFYGDATIALFKKNAS